jgi:hypothetical protein
VVDDSRKPRRHARHQTQTERDFEGLAARREREAAPPVRDLEDLTDRHAAAEIDDGELAEMRALRAPEDRIAKVERKADKLESAVTAVQISVGELKGGMETLIKLGTAAEAEREARHKREREERQEKDDAEATKAKREADERERRRKNLPLVIGALGTAIAAIVAAAAIHGCA